MLESIVTLIVGVVIIFIGISNTKGNLSALHSYHRNRVSEEDKLPFGKKVGAGMIIIGIGIILLSICTLVTYFTNLAIVTTIGIVIMVLGLIIGLFLAFSAMIKYNKGIF